MVSSPNIIHGHDPDAPNRLNCNGDVWHYLWIDPNGKVIRRGDAGKSEQGDGKEFALPKKIAKESNLGKLKAVREGMSDRVQAVLWSLEIGTCSEATLKKVRGMLKGDQKEELSDAIDQFLTGQIAEIRSLYKGSMDDRFQAYNKAVSLAGSFKTTSQCKKAREVVAFLEKDEQFKKELAAKKAYSTPPCRSSCSSQSPQCPVWARQAVRWHRVRANWPPTLLPEEKKGQ